MGLALAHGNNRLLIRAIGGVLALGMGIQGALVGAFNLPGVVANSLTGTVLKLAERSAIVVALSAASGLPSVVPVVIVTLAICALFVPTRQTVRALSTDV
jgi:hypothetical protein